MDKRKLGKWALVAIGCAAVVLGTIGIVVPLLPTTPFLLLAAACFVRSSDRLYAWLIRHRLFGAYIRNYREHRAITLWTKAVTIALLWVTIVSSAVWVVKSLWLDALLLLIACAVTTHLLRLKTLTPEMLARAGQHDDSRGEAARKQGTRTPEP